MIQICIVLFLFFFSPLASANAIGVERGDEAPGFTLSSTEGTAFRLRDSLGNIVVMMYWREDQNRSIKALEEMKTIRERYADKGVSVVSIVADSADQEKVKNIFKEKALQFPALIDIDRRVYGDYGIRVYPSTVIIDREGNVSHVIPGFALTYRMMLEGYIRHALGEIDDDQLRDEISPKGRAQTGGGALAAERKYNLALQFTNARLFDQAISAVQGSIEAKPDIAKAHVLLGFLLLEKEEAEKAEKEFTKALELDPGSHDAKTGLGGAMIAKGEVDAAISILEEAVRANPKPQMAYYELGRSYELKGEKDRAILMYKKAVDKIIEKRILPSSISSCE